MTKEIFVYRENYRGVFQIIIVCVESNSNIISIRNFACAGDRSNIGQKHYAGISALKNFKKWCKRVC